MATTPSSPKTISTNDAASPSKRPQPIPWTHQETVNLIRAYKEKWYSLKRGPLRSSQWEEVAVVVAARCGYDFNHPSKSAVQCRHKMEKLRQRHRSEKHRLVDGTAARAWQYFGLMDELQRGPLPISAQPLLALAPSADDDYNNNEDDDEDEDDHDHDHDDHDESKNYIKSKSINYILSQRPRSNKIGGFLREHVSKGMWRVDDQDHDHDHDHDEDDEEVEEEEEDDERVVVNEMELVSGLTVEIKAFTKRFNAMENWKMEMMKETERCRLEMENKRIEMILESRRRTVDSIGRAFGSSKRMKISQET